MPGPVVVIAGAIAVELAAEGAVWVIKKAWHASTRKPVLDFHRPPRLYDAASRRSFVLQPNGTYRLVDGPQHF